MMRHIEKILIMVFMAVAFPWLAAAPAWALTTINVTTTADVVDEFDGLTSLREAFDEVNTSADTEYVINLEGGMTYNLTIVGSGSDDQTNATGSLALTRAGVDVTINGSGGGLGQATIDASGLANPQKMLNFTHAGPSSSSLTLNDLEMRNSTFTAGQGGVVGGSVGGSDDSLELNRCYVHDNDSSGGGGVIGTSSLENITINDSTIADNAGGSTGGVIFGGSMAVNINNSTLTGNSASSGSVVYGSVYAITVRSSTIYDNTATSANQAAFNLIDSSLDIKNSILSGNSGGNCANPFPGAPTTVDSQGYNILGDLTGDCVYAGPQTGDQTGINDPMVAGLGDNGGPTPTHALLSTSPAIDSGDPSGCTDSNGALLDYDQRGAGFIREDDGDNNGSYICDSGAFELSSTFSEIADAIDDAMTGIAGLSPDVFGNGNKQNATLNKLDAVEDAFMAIEAETDPTVRAQLIASLEDKLTHDLLAKGDGCGTEPDNNDWIVDCDAQLEYRMYIQDLLDLLATL